MRRANGYAPPPEAAKGVQDGRAAAALFASIRATSRTGFMVGCSAFRGRLVLEEHRAARGLDG